jgi:NhaP-type Na+/H+ or K+/H+ antiporter
MRTIYWTIALAITGGVLATKTAVIEVEEVLKGSFLGALAGLVIGWIITKLERKPRDHKQ